MRRKTLHRLGALVLAVAACAGVAAVAHGYNLLLFGGGTKWTYLLRDLFLTPQSAPLTSPRTCEPGPGTLTVVDPGSYLSITNGTLACSGGSVSWRSSVVEGAALNRAAGRTLLTRYTQASGHNTIGWGLHNSTIVDEASFYGNVGPAFTLYDGGTAVVNIVPLSDVATYDVAIPLRAAGAFYLVRGGGYDRWTLLWVGAAGVASSISPQDINHSAAFTASNFRVLDLSTWSSDDKVYTSYLASPAVNSTGQHTADCLFDWTQATLPSAGTEQIDFRRTSATERWYLTLDSTGALALVEQTGGATTTRGSAAGVANGNRIVVIADGSTIKVYVANALQITYASATSNATATAWYVTDLGTGGAIANIYAWPRYPAFPAVP